MMHFELVGLFLSADPKQQQYNIRSKCSYNAFSHFKSNNNYCKPVASKTDAIGIEQLAKKK